MTLVVCSHLPGEGVFRSKRFEVVPVCCEDDHDYWAGLARAWESEQTIVNVEHDVEVTDAHVEELLACSHSLCSWAYRCHWISTGVPDGVIAAGNGERAHGSFDVSPGFLEGGEEFAAWSAIGLVKITAEARTGVLRAEPWSRLELAVHDAVKRPWHMHWPEVPHHHW